MELKSMRPLLADAKVDVDLSNGVSWLIIVDENSCDEIFRVITLANDQDFECEVYGILLEESEGVKVWVRSQGIKINCFVASEDKGLKEKLGINGVPWFTCVKNGRIVYTSGGVPEVLDYAEGKKEENEEDKEDKNEKDEKIVKSEQEDLIEMKSPVKKILDDLNEGVEVTGKTSLKTSTELPNTSLLINKQNETELEKALKKIDKLKLKVKQQEQTIEDYKIEVRQLRTLLAAKISETIEKPQMPMSESPMKSQLRNSYKVESMPKPKFQPRMNQRIDENEFWKIEDPDDLQESVKFEEIAASKDLWLMGLFKQKDSPKIPKASKILPPLQVEKQKGPNLIHHNASSRVHRNNSSVPPNFSKKVLKNY